MVEQLQMGLIYIRVQTLEEQNYQILNKLEKLEEWIVEIKK